MEKCDTIILLYHISVTVIVQSSKKLLEDLVIC